MNSSACLRRGCKALLDIVCAEAGLISGSDRDVMGNLSVSAIASLRLCAGTQVSRSNSSRSSSSSSNSRSTVVLDWLSRSVCRQLVAAVDRSSGSSS